MQPHVDQTQFGVYSARLEHHDEQSCMLRIRKERKSGARRHPSCIFDLAILAKSWGCRPKLVPGIGTSLGTCADTIVFVRLTDAEQSVAHQSCEQLVQIAKKYLFLMGEPVTTEPVPTAPITNPIARWNLWPQVAA
jgi:hypothetical protein